MALLRRQFGHVHELLEAAVGRAPGSAACYARAVVCEDICVNGVLAARWPLALTTWARRTGLSPLPSLGAPIDWRAWTRTVRLDLKGVRLYAAAVYEATDAYLAGLPDAPDITTARVLTGLLLTLSMLNARSWASTDEFRRPRRSLLVEHLVLTQRFRRNRQWNSRRSSRERSGW